MKILGLSEHFLPRVGGTVNYVHETCSALAALGHEITLLVPKQQPDKVDPEELPYNIVWIDADYPAQGNPSRSARYDFCVKADTWTRQAAARGEMDVVHVFFGLFLMETLATAKLKDAGIACGATVHNLPPMECSVSWPGDKLHARLKDRLRVNAVAWKNNNRLKRHDYELYITPSDQVSEALAKVRPSANIQTIFHGVNDELITQMTPPASRRPEPGEPLRLLTVGGWAPHKRQHLIPEIAERLRAAGLDFHWRVSGPAGRISGYKDAIDKDLARRGLEDAVATSDSVPFSDLPKLYDAANLYIQPSTEEGFCMTALDAAAAGLPVIGSPAGALPQIVEISGGRLVKSDAAILASTILEFSKPSVWSGSPADRVAAVRNQYSWVKAAEQLVQKLDLAVKSDHTLT